MAENYFGDSMLWGRIKEHEGTWTEKKEGMFRQLDSKVQFGNFLFEKSETLEAGDPEFKQKVEQIWSEGLQTFDPEAAEKFSKYFSLENEKHEQTKAVLVKAMSLAAAEWKKKQKKELGEIERGTYVSDQIEQRIDAITDEQQKLDPTHQLEFFLRIRFLVDDLLVKRDQVVDIADDTEAVLHAVGRACPEIGLINSNEVVRIVRGPFSITIVLSKEEYKKKFSNKNIKSVGLHFTDTPFNFVVQRDTVAQENSTVHHENVHNLTDGAIVNENPTAEFDRKLEHYKSRLIKSKKGSVKLRQFKAVTAELALESMVKERQYIDLLHGEIVAAFEQAEEEGFASKGFLLTDFEQTVLPFRTAGQNIIRLLEKIKATRKTEGKGNEALVQALKGFESRLKKRISGVFEKMKLYLHAAERSGERAREDVETLFFILKPMQYRHIAEYLNEKYGEDGLLEAEAVDCLTEFSTIDDLRFGVEALRKKPELLDETLKTQILNQVTDYSDNFLGKMEDVGIATLKSKREYVRYFKELMSMCNFADKKYEEFFVAHINFAFADHLIEKDGKEEFVNLQELYGSFDEEEKEGFFAALQGGLEYLMEDLELNSFEELKKRPLWKVLEKIGLADRIAERMK